MPRKKAYATKRISEPKVSDGIFYALLIGLFVALISGVYFRSLPCVTNCIGENIINGYPYGWFSYNTYEGWQSGMIIWMGAILDMAFWAFIAYIVMLVFYAAIKEV
jgi:hypothetical protein